MNGICELLTKRLNEKGSVQGIISKLKNVDKTPSVSDFAKNKGASDKGFYSDGKTEKEKIAGLKPVPGAKGSSVDDMNVPTRDNPKNLQGKEYPYTWEDEVKKSARKEEPGQDNTIGSKSRFEVDSLPIPKSAMKGSLRQRLLYHGEKEFKESLAYGVDGEIELELENNYGDYADWDRETVATHLDDVLNNILTFADDPKDRKKILYIQKSQDVKDRIIDEFIESHIKTVQSERRFGRPRTDQERLRRHQARFPEDSVKTVKDLPKRGTGRMMRREGFLGDTSIIEKKETDPSLKPPKKWFDDMMKEIKSGNPDYTDEQIEKTIGDIWYNQLTDEKRSEIRNREGKTYGPAPESLLKSFLETGNIRRIVRNYKEKLNVSEQRQVDGISLSDFVCLSFLSLEDLKEDTVKKLDKLDWYSVEDESGEVCIAISFSQAVKKLGEEAHEIEFNDLSEISETEDLSDLTLTKIDPGLHRYSIEDGFYHA